MNYLSLTKYRYKHPSDYEAVYARRFNDKKTIHFGFQINGNEAFFFTDPEVSDLLAVIYQINEEYLKFEDEIPVLEAVLNHCIFQEIKMTNEIEGIHSTYQELQQAYSQSQDKADRGKFVGQMREYLKLKNGDDPGFPKNCDEIRELYNHLLYDDVLQDDPTNRLDGEIFRKEAVSVLSGNRVFHPGITPEKEIIRILDTSLEILDRSHTDPVVYSALFHFIFCYVHPFYDGNGRLARYLSQIKLAETLKPAGVLHLSSAVRQNRSKYYQAFSECEKFWNRGDLTPFVIAFLELIVAAMKSGLEVVKECHYKYHSG